MASSALRALKTALETREFDPTYLFHGDDDFLKEEKVRAVIESATDPATRASMSTSVAVVKWTAVRSPSCSVPRQ